MNPIAMPRFAPSTLMMAAPAPASAPAPAAAPSAPPAACDTARISNLRNQAAVCRHNGMVAGLGIGAIAAMVGMSGSVPGAVICGGMGAFVLFTNFNRANQLEQQAAQLEGRCGKP